MVGDVRTCGVPKVGRYRGELVERKMLGLVEGFPLGLPHTVARNQLSLVSFRSCHVRATCDALLEQGRAGIQSPWRELVVLKASHESRERRHGGQSMGSEGRSF